MMLLLMRRVPWITWGLEIVEKIQESMLDILMQLDGGWPVLRIRWQRYEQISNTGLWISKLTSSKGTFGPMASAFNICSLAQPWRMTLSGKNITDPKWYASKLELDERTQFITIC
jgi:hypothetical protein